MTLSVSDIQHNGTLRYGVYCYAECHYAECRYAGCHYAECRFAEYPYAECRFAECHGAINTTLILVKLECLLFNEKSPLLLFKDRC